MTVYMPATDYKAICDATREKCGTTGLLKSGDIQPLLAALETDGAKFYLTVNVDSGSTVTATKGMAGDVLEYIESTGTQYIITDFYADQDSRIIADFEYNGGDLVFGAYNTGGGGGFAIQNVSGKWYQYYGSSNGATTAAANTGVRYLADWNKNVASIDGVVVRTAAANTFKGDYPIILCGHHNAANIANLSKTKIYSTQMYAASVIKRDYVPFRLLAGDVGLLDRANNVFYPNAGTGVFGAGSVVETIEQQTVTVTAVDGKAVLELPEAGTWQITSTLNGQSATAIVEVVGEFEAEAYFFTADPVFANNSWPDIIKACQLRKVPDTWVVGDQKPMPINGTDYTIDIIDKDHDDYADGSGKAPLTLQMHYVYGTDYAMNATNTIDGAWEDSAMRNTHLPAILALMPTEVQTAIREVRKPSNIADGTNGVTGLGETVDKLFLLSQFEMLGTVTYSVYEEGERYAYYAAGNSSQKFIQGTTSAKVHSLRSVRQNYIGFCAISGFGGISFSQANTANGVAPAFCF